MGLPEFLRKHRFSKIVIAAYAIFAALTFPRSTARLLKQLRSYMRWAAPGDDENH